MLGGFYPHEVRLQQTSETNIAGTPSQLNEGPDRGRERDGVRLGTR